MKSVTPQKDGDETGVPSGSAESLGSHGVVPPVMTQRSETQSSAAHISPSAPLMRLPHIPG